MRRWFPWPILLILAGLLLLGLVWLSLTADPEITALRNMAHYQVVQALGGPKVRTDEPPGTITGLVRDDDGRPVADAEVLVASPLGHRYTAESDAQGHYRIADVPPGRYVPVAGKRGYVDGPEMSSFKTSCTLRWVSQRCLICRRCRKHAVLRNCTLLQRESMTLHHC